MLSELDFPTDGHVWLAWAAKTGAEIVWLRSPDGLTIPIEAYDEAIDERTAVVMVNRVLYRSSAIVDAKAVCAMARERGALSFVDDYHGLGIVPLDLHDLGCDLYTAGTLEVDVRRARAWCSSTRGARCCRRWNRRSRVGSRPRSRSRSTLEHLAYHPTARRLEHGTPPAPVFFLAQGGIDIISEVGVERVRARQGELTDHVIARSDEAGLAGAHAAGASMRGGRGERAGRRRRRRDLPRAARARRVHRLPRRRPAHQPALLQHGSRHRPLLRGAGAVFAAGELGAQGLRARSSVRAPATAGTP